MGNQLKKSGDRMTFLVDRMDLDPNILPFYLSCDLNLILLKSHTDSTQSL